MANSTFSGPIRSKGGFKEIDENATTGVVTENISITSNIIRQMTYYGFTVLPKETCALALFTL